MPSVGLCLLKAAVSFNAYSLIPNDSDNTPNTCGLSFLADDINLEPVPDFA